MVSHPNEETASSEGPRFPWRVWLYLHRQTFRVCRQPRLHQTPSLQVLICTACVEIGDRNPEMERGQPPASGTAEAPQAVLWGRGDLLSTW